MKSRTKWWAALLLVAVTAVSVAQYRGGRDRRNWLPPEQDRYGVPEWTNEAGYEKDSFTFTRVQYTSQRGYGRGSRGGWATDYRDADLNLSFRLHQMTSMQVDPDAKVVKLTDADLFNYPFLYISEPGALEFSDAEVEALRKYLLNGGFLMIDDHWGVNEYENIHNELRRVFPTREPVELPPEHPIFHCVFDLKEKPQVPGVHAWLNSGLTYERWDAKTVEYKGIFDDKDRMMVIICHNTDLGDGWEEEATNPDYFKQFSEKFAYPLAVNIFHYAMTH